MTDGEAMKSGSIDPLKEFEVRQIKDDPPRRWFSNNYFDLIVWYHGDRIFGFQLCYDVMYAERALTWTQDEGFSHNRIDDGEGVPGKNLTPILVEDGVFDRESILSRFRAESKLIDGEVRDFVIRKLEDYAPPGPPPPRRNGTR